MQIQTIKLTIENWINYQPRKDLAKLTWYRIDSDLIGSELHKFLGNDGLVFFMYLLAACAAKNTAAVQFTAQDAQDVCKIQHGEIERFIKILEHFQIVRDVVQTCTDLSPTLHNKTNITNNTLQNTTDITTSSDGASATPPAPPKKPSRRTSPEETEQNRLIKNAFVESYKARYNVEPLTQNATFNTQVSNLRKKVGVEDAVRIVQFYLKHNDGFYLKNTHTFGHCLRDCETLRTQMQRNRAITSADVKGAEKNLRQASNVQEAKKGGF